jgi:hypothetical protein
VKGKSIMRRLIVSCVALSLAAAAAVAAEIKTGRDLVDACRSYASANGQENARAPNDCRTFLQGFAVSLKAREDARLDAMVKGLPAGTKEACVRMPDFISFKELAERIVRFGDANPALLNGPATDLAQKTLERDFPCPPPAKP